MGDEMTPGEISRTFNRQDSAIRATNDRLAETARQMVTAELFAAEHRALMERVARHEQDSRDDRDRRERVIDARFAAVDKEIAAAVKAIEDHEGVHQSTAAWSRNKTLTVIAIVVGAIATIAGAWVAAVLAAKGVG